jgi:hypothetical protein
MRERQRELSFALMLGGLLIWAVHFGIVYGFTGLVCARPSWARLTVAGWALLPFGITLATLAAVAAIIAVLMALAKRANAGPQPRKIPAAQLQHFLAFGGAGIALIAIVWESLSALMIPACRGFT